MATVTIAGGTGLIGSALTGLLLRQGYEVIVLSRRPGRQAARGFQILSWDPSKGGVDREAIEKADHIINLAGTGIADKRWSKKRKQEIAGSRVRAGETIVRALASIPNHVQSVVNASATGWYGPDPSIPSPHPFTESMPHATGYLGETVHAWEASIDPVQGMNKRLVKIRTGIVLSPTGGALQEFRKPVRMGIAAILGSGRQMISWIHIDDLCRIYLSAIENEKMAGVYNAVAPSPVTNRELVLKLAEKMKGRFYVPVYVPSFVLKLALGEMSVEVLKSVTVRSEKLHGEGFSFLYPSIDAALGAL